MPWYLTSAHTLLVAFLFAVPPAEQTGIAAEPVCSAELAAISLAERFGFNVDEAFEHLRDEGILTNGRTMDCMDLQQASATPAGLRTVFGRRAIQAFYTRCGFWLLRGAFDSAKVERLAAAAAKMERMPFESPSRRSFTTPEVEDPWDTTVGSLFAAVNASLPGLMRAPDVELMKVQLMVAAANTGVDQDIHYDHSDADADSGTAPLRNVRLMLGWIPLHRLLSDQHAPMELWPGSHLGSQAKHLSTSATSRSIRLGPQLDVGDMLMMDHALMHRGSANSESRDREILNIDFCAGASGQCEEHRNEAVCSADMSPSMESWGGRYTTR